MPVPTPNQRRGVATARLRIYSGCFPSRLINSSSWSHTDGIERLPAGTRGRKRSLQKLLVTWLSLASCPRGPRPLQRECVVRQSVKRWMAAELEHPRLASWSARACSAPSARKQGTHVLLLACARWQCRTPRAVRPLLWYASRSDGLSPTPMTCHRG